MTAGHPELELRQLLKAYACPIDEARLAWRSWLEWRSIEDATWAEVRILAALAGRMAWIDPESPQRPLLEGIRRFVWTRNQARLDNSMTAIDLLISAGIPVMVLKGMARIAANPELASSRYVRDIDLMIESHRIDHACDVLIVNGWRPCLGQLPGESRAESFGRLSPEASGEEQGLQEDIQIDIHRSAIHFGRSGTFDDVFWTRAQDAILRTRPVKVPSDTDQFLHAVAHGAVSDVDRPVDWVIDALEASRAGGFSWVVCATELGRRHMGAAIADNLEFLETELGLQIPGNIHRIVQRDIYNPLYRAEAAVYRKLPDNRSRLDRACMRWAEWLRSRRCSYQPQKRRTTLWKGRKLRGEEKRITKGSRTTLAAPITRYLIDHRDLRTDNALVLDIETGEGAVNRIEFDLLLGHVWFGRLRFKPPLRRYQITIPGDMIGQDEICHLYLVFINQHGQIPAALPFQIAASLTPAGRSAVSPRPCSIEEVMMSRGVSVRSDQTICA